MIAGRYDDLLFRSIEPLLPVVVVVVSLGCILGFLLWRQFQSSPYRRGRS